MNDDNKQDEFDKILDYCGFTSGIHSRISHLHLKTYLLNAKKYDGFNENKFLSMMRISLGIDSRYIKDIHEGFVEFGIIKINKGCINYIYPKNGDLFIENHIKEESEIKQKNKKEKPLDEKFKKGMPETTKILKSEKLYDTTIEKEYENYIQNLENGVKKLSFDEWKLGKNNNHK